MKIKLYPACQNIEDLEKNIFIISFADPASEELDNITPDVEGLISSEDVYINSMIEKLRDILNDSYVYKK